MKTLFNKGLADIKTLGIRLVQHEDEFLWLFEKVYKLQPKIYFQIGSFQGACEVVLSRACAENAIIVSIDNGTEGRKGEDRLTAIERSSDYLNMKGYRSFVIEGDSANPLVVKKAYGLLHENDKPDFVYIDGGHALSQTMRDWDNYRVRIGGLVSIHDINHNCNKGVETPKAWLEIAKSNIQIAIGTEQCILHDKNGGVGIIYY